MRRGALLRLRAALAAGAVAGGIAAAVVVAAVATAAAQEISVLAQVESQDVYAGEPFIYQIQVEGADDVRPPDLSGLADFTAQFLGGSNNSSTSITIVNGRMEKIAHRGYVMQFRLTAKRAGQLVIPSVNVAVKGKSYATNAIGITARHPTETEEFKLRMSLSRAKCYVGEPVVLTVTWYISRDVESFQFTMPVLENAAFAFEDPTVKIDPSRQYYRVPIGGREVIAEKGQATLDGVTYATLSFRKAVIPRQSGMFVIPETVVSCTAVTGMQRSRDFFDDFFSDNFFGRRRGQLKQYAVPSNTLALDVAALPAEGRPAGFAGHVGAYRISTRATPTEVNVGDPITLSVVVEGPDYLGSVDLPPLGEQPALARDFKVPEERADGKVEGRTKVFTQTIRARSESVKEIPPVSLVYFDTKSRRYATASSVPIPIVVHPTKLVTAVDAEGVSAGPVGAPLESWKEGIAYNYEGRGLLERQTFGLAEALASPRWLALLLAPPAAYAVLLSVVIARRRAAADTAGRRSRGAYRALSKRLAAAGRGGERGIRLCEEVMAAVREYLGAKLGVSGATLTTADARRMLEERGVSTAAVAVVREALDSCEAGAYAGEVSSAADGDALVRRALDAAAAIEKEL